MNFHSLKLIGQLHKERCKSPRNLKYYITLSSTGSTGKGRIQKLRHDQWDQAKRCYFSSTSVMLMEAGKAMFLDFKEHRYSNCNFQFKTMKKINNKTFVTLSRKNDIRKDSLVGKSSSEDTINVNSLYLKEDEEKEEKKKSPKDKLGDLDHHLIEGATHEFDWNQLRREKKMWNGYGCSKDLQLIQDLRSNHAGETGAVYIYKGALFASELGNRYIRPNFVSDEAISFSKMHLETEQLHLDLFNKLFSLKMNGEEKTKDLYSDHEIDFSLTSKLLPIWRVAGFVLGFLPTFFYQDKGLFITVEAVETFVEKHYLEQIERLELSLHRSKFYAMQAEEGSNPLGWPIEKKKMDIPMLSSQSASMMDGQESNDISLDLREYPETISLLRTCCEDEVHHKEDAALRWKGQGKNQQQLENNLIALWKTIVGKGSEFAVLICRRI